MKQPGRQDGDLADRFRLGMRRHASNVCLVATSLGGVRYGMTATAVSSVSADPPTLLVCVNKGASLHTPIREAGRFSVNVLGERHRDLAARFSGAGPREARFDITHWRDREGWTHLADAGAAFLLTTEAVLDHHSHSVIIARVEDVVFGPDDVAPLIYHDGDYTSCLRPPSPS